MYQTYDLFIKHPFEFDPESHLAGNRDKFYIGFLFIGIGISTSTVDQGLNKVWTTSISLGLGASVLAPISTGVNTGKIRLKKIENMEPKIMARAIAAFVLGIAGLVWLLNIDETVVPFNEIIKEYPYVLREENIDSEVIEIYCAPKTRGCGGIYSMVVFDNKLKRTIYAPRDISDSLVLSQILTIGSRIRKTRGSDTVYVFLQPDQAEPYKFVLRRINKTN